MPARTLAVVRRTALALCLLSTLAFAQGVQPTRTVDRPVLNMFSGPSADSDVVSQAIYGTTVTILEEKNGWAQIQTPDQYKGWAEAAGLLHLQHDYAVGGLPGDPQPVWVTSMFAHLYRERDVTAHAPLLTVPFETRLELAEIPGAKARWALVRLVDGRTAYVQTADVTTAHRPLSIDESIALGKRFLGLPYTWGGTSTYGYDCSGFTQMLVRQRGGIMPRDADQQAAWSGVVSVEKSQLKPGDLLFFGSSPQNITHTGMYIGDGLFLNATTHEKPVVRIDNLSEAHWTRLYVGARRLKP